MKLFDGGGGAQVRNGLRLAAICAVAFALAYLCLIMPRGAGRVAPIWLPNAVILALLCLSSRSRWPAIALMGGLGNILANLAVGDRPSLAVVLALCNTLEFVAGAGLLRQVLGPAPDMARIGAQWRYALIAAAVSLASAALASLFLGGSANAAGLSNFVTWAMADFAGLVIVTPCVVVLATQRSAWAQVATRAFWPLAALLAVVLYVFLQTRYPLGYLVVAALLVVTWRARLVGAAMGVLGTLAIATVCTVLDLGPFARIDGSVAERVLALQAFLAVCFYLSLPVAAQAERSREMRAALAGALDEAREAEARYRLIAERAHDIIVRADLSGRIVYISPSCQALGYHPEDLLGVSGAELVHPEDLTQYAENTLQLVRDGEAGPARDRQHRFKCKDGSYVWLEGNPTVLRDETGAPIELLNVFRDVSERRATAATQAESDARYRLLTDNMTDVIACYGRDGVLKFLSPAVQTMLGYPAAELVGRSIVSLMHPDDVEPSGAHFRKHFEAGSDAEPFKFEYRLYRKDGEVIWLEAHPRAIRDSVTGEFIEWQDVIRDITAHKALEAQLQAARVDAEAATEVKSEFLANMSHELRTPLTSVVGFTRLIIEQPELSPLTRTYVERVNDASRALLSAVNDILDFSKLEAGQVSFRPEPAPLAPFVRSALDLFQPQAGAKDLTLTLDGDLPADLVVMLDPDRMRQVLLNLIGNAVKFTDTGSVTLRVDYDEATETLAVAVRDTGAGIPEEGLDRLFKRFSQVDGSLTRAHGGTGLGLAICKGIIEAAGGAISVTSEVGKGSCFAFTVPVVRADAARHETGHAVDTVTFSGVRVLVADDHPANRELVRLFLAGVGAEITEAEDGAEAAELAASWPFDVILMDLRMPRLDGPGALRRIRGAPGPNDATPILAFTADADPEIGTRMFDLGFQGLVSKPVTPVELISAIAQATAFAHQAGNAEAGVAH